jgi:hypothetical protein
VGFTAFNRTVTVRRLKRLGYKTTQSAQAPLWAFFPPHFCAAQRLRVALMRRKNVSYSRNVRRHKKTKAGLGVVRDNNLQKRFLKGVAEV